MTISVKELLTIAKFYDADLDKYYRPKYYNPKPIIPFTFTSIFLEKVIGLKHLQNGNPTWLTYYNDEITVRLYVYDRLVDICGKYYIYNKKTHHRITKYDTLEFFDCLFNILGDVCNGS